MFASVIARFGKTSAAVVVALVLSPLALAAPAVAQTDVTPPETILAASGDAVLTTGPPVIFWFSSTEPGSTFTCDLDGHGWFTCYSPTPGYSMPVGSHVFSVFAIDPAGNVDPTAAVQTVVVCSPIPIPIPTPVPAGPTTPIVGTGASCSMPLGDRIGQAGAVLAARRRTPGYVQVCVVRAQSSGISRGSSRATASSAWAEMPACHGTGAPFTSG